MNDSVGKGGGSVLLLGNESPMVYAHSIDGGDVEVPTFDWSCRYQRLRNWQFESGQEHS